MHVRGSWFGVRLSRGIHAVPGAMVMPLAIGFGLVLAGVGASTASASITEYRSYPTSNPQQIVAGADGNPGTRMARVCLPHARIRPGHRTGHPLLRPDGRPDGVDPAITGITAGPDGALWFTGYSDDYIGRVTTSGRSPGTRRRAAGKSKQLPFS